jgi:rod shape-determining protein MreC
MNELIYLLVRYKNFILFLILQVIFFSIYIQNNHYPNAVFSEKTLAITAAIDQHVLFFEKYLGTPKENQELLEENARLKESLLYYQKIISQDSTKQVTEMKEYQIIPARVINRNYLQKVNWVTLNKGIKDGVGVQMGVITDRGIVGVVVAASEHYSLVRTILDNSKYPFSPTVYLPDIQTYSTIYWEDTYDYQKIVLKDIPYHLPVELGMKVYSSDESLLFVEQIAIGIVEQIALDPATNRFELQVRLYTDFHNIRNVYVVQNCLKEEYQKIQEFSK